MTRNMPRPKEGPWTRDRRAADPIEAEPVRGEAPGDRSSRGGAERRAGKQTPGPGDTDPDAPRER